MIFPIEPILNYRVWGGEYLKAIFNRKDITGPVGEVFLLSSMSEADSIIDGQTFSEFYKRHPEYFGLRCQRFPLRINLIDACADLSVQLHPVAENLKDPQFPNGIEELWYVVKAEANSKLVLGLKTDDKERVAACFTDGNWQSILNYYPVVENALAFLPAGLVHAIGKGCLIYELTYSHDITYRLFDYNRVDSKTGVARAIHKEEGLKNIDFSAKSEVIICDKSKSESVFKRKPGFILDKFLCEDYLRITQDNFYFYTVIAGNGTINDWETALFMTYFIPKTQAVVEFRGNLEVLRTTYIEAD